MKKGFTLIEMLAVLVIISILAVISVISVINIQNVSKTKIYNEQIKRIETSSKLWAVENSGTLYDKSLYYLSVEEMVNGNFLDNEEVIDPRNNMKMSGCVIITYENDKYSYKYDEYCGQTTYEIIYNLDGGYENQNIKIYTNMTKTFTLNNPAKFGYTFLGWSGTEIDGMSQEVTIEKGSEGNRTYTANWQRNEYAINYILNGGTFATPNPLSYYEDGLTIAITPPVKLGYTFLGWSGTGITGTVKYLKIAKGSNGDKEYTANWQLNNYSIIYTLNDGIVDGTNPTTYTAETETFTLINPTKMHYRFIGWTENDMSIAIPILTIEKGSAGNKKYIANWEKISSTLTIDPNGGVWNGTTSQVVAIGETINIENPTNGKYMFGGWEVSDDNSKISGTAFTMGNVDTIITAKWRTLNELDYSYTGDSLLIDDGDGSWRIKFLTSGTLTIKSGLTIDVFLVGGGGGGAPGSPGNLASGGGGGGYTNTVKGISLVETTFDIVVGNGGGSGGRGGTSTAFGQKADGGYPGVYEGGGGAGGSTGGAGGSKQSNSLAVWYNQGGAGGSNGNGQSTSTCEFDEGVRLGSCNPSIDLYAGGGGGGGAHALNGATGGAGGGGNGVNGWYAQDVSQHGKVNTGGGGGGGHGYDGGAGGSGGSGIVIIRDAR